MWRPHGVFKQNIPQIDEYRFHPRNFIFGSCDVIMGGITSQITSLVIVYSTIYSDADQSKHQSSASLAFVWGIHRWAVNSPHKWPLTRKMSPFDDVIMNLLFFNKHAFGLAGAAFVIHVPTAWSGINHRSFGVNIIQTCHAIYPLYHHLMIVFNINRTTQYTYFIHKCTIMFSQQLPRIRFCL